MVKEQKELLSLYARKVVENKLSVPIIFFLESTKSLAFIGGQALTFLGPMFTLFINEKKYYQFIELTEERENIEIFLCEIENYENKLKKQNL